MRDAKLEKFIVAHDPEAAALRTATRIRDFRKTVAAKSRHGHDFMAEMKNIAFESTDDTRFLGAKVTIFVGRRIITVLRDNKGTIPWPNHWEVPGGGREGFETPWDCASRETEEEIGIALSRQDMIWARAYQTGEHTHWFFVAKISEARASVMALRDEGQALALVDVDSFLANTQAVPRFQARLADWIAGVSGSL